jgi:gamma-glutamyl:cysteine ligase YbdK (ATP-grasp superfamily)
VKLYAIDDIRGIRGFSALTQEVERNELLLLDNINSLGGKKSLGFNQTRRQLLNNEFDREALEEMIEIAIELKNSIGNKVADKFIRQLMKQLAERVLRDHVALDMVETFRHAIVHCVESNNGDFTKTIKNIEVHINSNIVSVAETYRQALKLIERKKVV